MSFSFDSLTKMACFGIAGNFTGHLEQAGEAKDFIDVKTQELIAPKAIFPTFIPIKNSSIRTPNFLTRFPFDSKKILYPKDEQKIQLEPECAIIFNVIWNNKKVKNIIPILFGASNDCSIRKEGVSKISQKKNWGKSSKGLSENLIYIDSFTEDGILNRYRIASFMIRDKKVLTYGEDSAVRDYSYFYQKLNTWIIEKLNNQQDQGPIENIAEYLQESSFPNQIMISIGATRYTNFGKTNFFKEGDESVVVLYPEDKYSFAKIKTMLENEEKFQDDVSLLCQKIILGSVSSE